MENKIRHHAPKQAPPGEEFLPLLRTEAPYYGNLNRAAKSAYDFAADISDIVSWGGTVSILNPSDQTHTYHLYEIAKIVDGELLSPATITDSLHSRYGIVVAEAEFNSVSGLYENIAVCTFCPNFVYPVAPAWTSSANGSLLYLEVPNTDATFLKPTPGMESGDISRSALATKTGSNSIFFSGTIRLFGTTT